MLGLYALIWDLPYCETMHNFPYYGDNVNLTMVRRTIFHLLVQWMLLYFSQKTNRSVEKFLQTLMYSDANNKLRYEFRRSEMAINTYNFVRNNLSIHFQSIPIFMHSLKISLSFTKFVIPIEVGNAFGL